MVKTHSGTAISRSQFLFLLAAILLLLLLPVIASLGVAGGGSKHSSILTLNAQSLSTKTVIIPTGLAISTSVDTKDQPILGFDMPSSWTAANLTFQTSFDGSAWKDVYNMYGAEFTVLVTGASRFIAVSPLEFQWHRYIRIRSGTGALPVNQGGDRYITVVTRRVDR